MKHEFSRQIFRKTLKYQNWLKFFQWEPTCSMRTDELADMTKLTAAFRKFAKAPTKSVMGAWFRDDQTSQIRSPNLSTATFGSLSYHRANMRSKWTRTLRKCSGSVTWGESLTSHIHECPSRIALSSCVDRMPWENWRERHILIGDLEIMQTDTRRKNTRERHLGEQLEVQGQTTRTEAKINTLSLFRNVTHATS